MIKMYLDNSFLIDKVVFVIYLIKHYTVVPRTTSTLYKVYSYNVEQFSTVYETMLYETMLYKVLQYKRCRNPWIRTTLAFNIVQTQLRTMLKANVVRINSVRCNISTVIPHTMLYKSKGVRGNIV